MDSEPRRFQLVLGPRRVGKTTCLYQTVRHLLAQGVAKKRIWWLRLDHPLFLDVDLGSLVEMALALGHASAEAPCYLLLDEVTYASKWNHWLKTFYDERWHLHLAGSSS